MAAQASDALDDLARASARLARERGLNGLVSVFVEQALDLTRSDLAALYFYKDPDAPEGGMTLFYRRGVAGAPAELQGGSEVASFLRECDDTLVVNGPGSLFFSAVFLVPGMRSGIALPLSTPRGQLGMLLLNAREAGHYGRARFSFLDSFRKMAGNMLQNARLNDELRKRLAEIALMERYQENIFSSMTNLLITTDESGTIRYLNQRAQERLGLGEDAVGQTIERAFGGSLDKKVLKAIRSALLEKREILGIEGIFQGSAGSIDFSLNVSPLRTKRGSLEGLTLLFTDQTAEQALKGRMEVVVEERRLIKDMFARYLSNDVVENLVQHPELVKPGGDKKNATVFFGDIRGYTSFSENKPPEYIIEVLNEYFSEAVEIIIRHKGFIDKFIGDAIMAAWGVPMQSETTDAVEAVSSALEIQELVRSSKRSFFTGQASKLQGG